MEPTHTLLCQAESLANRSMNPSLKRDMCEAHATTAIALALIAIGQQLAELNAKRPIIPLIRVNGSDPAADDCLGDED